MSDIAKSVGAEARRVRRALDLTQTQLGERCRPPLAVQAVARFEAGGVGPTLEMVYRIAAGLGVRPHDLLPDPPPAPRGGRRRG